MIKYIDVIENGFVFEKINIDPIKKDLNSVKLHINEDRELGKEVSWSTYGMSHVVNDFLKKELSEISDDYTKTLINKIKTFEAYKTDINEYTKLHTDTSFGGLIQIMIYYIKDELKGRNFLYGSRDNIKSIQPYSGLVIVCDQLNQEWVHGTTPLLNNCYNLCITVITPK